jgi:hypothetical protein
VLVVALGGRSAAAADGAPAARGTGGTAAAAAPVVSGTFVGKAAGGLQVGVTVVAEQPAAEGQARTISLYVCSGTSLSAWLTGQTSGNAIDLRSADGRVGAHVSLSALAATGKVGLLGGSGFGFTARRAVGVAGLFDLTIATNGTLHGASTSGARLSGRLGAPAKLAASRTAVVTASVGGRTVKLTAPARHLRPGVYRWIVLTDGTVFGANRRGPGFGGIGGLPTLTLGPNGTRSVRITSAAGAGQPGYTDEVCASMAAIVDGWVDIAAAGIQTGNQAVADRAGALAADARDELDSQCLVDGKVPE